MDNGTSEYTFVTTFFAPEPDLPPAHTPQVVSSHLFSPTLLSVPLPADDTISSPATDVDPLTPRPRERTDSIFSNESLRSASRLSKEDQTTLNAIWKQIMDPSLEHAKVVLCLSFALCVRLINTDERRRSYKPRWIPCHL
jgi:vacuolar protein sorting-associated protein 52